MLGHILKLSVFGLILAILFRILPVLDLFKNVENLEPGKCTLLGIENGAEDIELLEEKLAIITSGLKWDRSTTKENIKGRLIKLTLEGASKVPVAKELKIENNRIDMKRFNPHGLSSLKLNNEKYLIYVINHLLPIDGKAPEESIEVFHYDKNSPDSIAYVKSIKSDKFHDPNDLILIDEDKFFFTNSYHTNNKWLRMIEMISFYASGSVAYYDGKPARLLNENLNIPNGIAISQDKKRLYVVQSGHKTVESYKVKWNGDVCILSHIATSLVENIGDNIILEAGDTANEDVLWIAGHPIGWKIIFSTLGAHISAPSLAARLEMKNGVLMRNDIVYSNNGSMLRGSSTVRKFGSGIVVGTVGHDALFCECDDKVKCIAH